MLLIGATTPIGVVVTGQVCPQAAFVLAVVDGVSPDEHTWPITFSWHASGPHGGATQVRRSGRGMRSAISGERS